MADGTGMRGTYGVYLPRGGIWYHVHQVLPASICTARGGMYTTLKLVLLYSILSFAANFPGTRFPLDIVP